MDMVSGLLKKERIKHYLETWMGADKKLVTLENVDCIHLTWFLDNALKELQITCKFGCVFYLDMETHDIACAGRIPYPLLERTPDCSVSMIDGIWEFFSDVGDELMAVAQGSLTAREAFRLVIDKEWGNR